MILINLQKTLKYGKDFLKENGIISYDIDAKVLLMYVLDIDKATLLTSDFPVSDETLSDYKKLLEKRSTSYPVAYITNNQEFMSLPFYVDENVLIPRGDTEILVEKAISLIKMHSLKTMLDMCTGQGAIAISVAKYTDILVTASDIDENCVSIAEKNAKLNDVSDNITFVTSDLFNNLKPQKFDIIASNPPYISKNEMKDLMKDVLYEPHLALTDNGDGLFFYKNIIKNSLAFLNDGGFLLLEIGYNQKEDVHAILEEHGYKDISVLYDLNGHTRTLCAVK